MKAAIADLRSAMEDENAGEAELAPKIQALMTVSMKVGEAMYKPQEEAGDGGHAGGDDSVVDADFEEIDDSRKTKTCSAVILSEAKDLQRRGEILRCAQDDNKE